MIFVDSNIPMYLVGGDYPNKVAARRRLEQAIVDNVPLASDAEVLQELLHRYVAIGRRDAIGPACDALLGVVDVVHPIELEDVTRARRLAETAPGLSARDAVHLAVMQRHGITRILTFDTGFDGIVGVERIGF
ncbi:MAG TPA: type II toxin-antitoxin system VapC family toxin [Candidatus Limnocylindrales bacterium]|nr:type II toxin-antitoxin system VapC family toxin [Candidatus Limnocylindrales bacterium]